MGRVPCRKRGRYDEIAEAAARKTMGESRTYKHRVMCDIGPAAWADCGVISATVLGSEVS